MGARSSKSRLCKEDLEFLKEKTRYDESTITEWYKGFIQVDHHPGGLSWWSKSNRTARTDFSRSRPSWRSTPSASQLATPRSSAITFLGLAWFLPNYFVFGFRTFDRDKNNFIDFKEFLLAIDVTSGGSPKEKLQWAFRWRPVHQLAGSPSSLCRMYDVDGNGVIDLQEMVKIVASIYKMMGDEQVAEKHQWWKCQFLSCFQAVALEEGGPEERASAIFKVKNCGLCITLWQSLKHSEDGQQCWWAGWDGWIHPLLSGGCTTVSPRTLIQGVFSLVPPLEKFQVQKVNFDYVRCI